MTAAGLDCHRVLDSPHPITLGALPADWSLVTSPVVVNLCGLYPAGDPGGHLVLGFPLLDALDRSLAPDQATLERFLAGCHELVVEHASYWHCHAGINRSGFALAAYLHVYRGYRISEAIDHLRRVRSEMVLCNHLFEGLLRAWYGAPDEQEFQRVNLQTYLTERKGTTEDPG